MVKKKKRKNFPVYQKALEDIKKNTMASLIVKLNNTAATNGYPGVPNAFISTGYVASF